MNTIDRLAKIRSFLVGQQAQAMLISSPSNLYYLAGFVCLSPTEREAYVLVTPKAAYLITSPLYAGDGDQFSKDIILKTTESSFSFADIVDLICKDEHIKTIGIEDHNLTVNEYHELLDKKLSLVPIYLRGLRMKKTIQEIAAVEKACQIGDEAFTFTMQKIKQGITEKELATELEIFVRKQGADMSFPTIIGFGEHAAIPHHVTTNYQLQTNNFVLMDFGIKFDNYCSDMTRTVYVGKPSEEEKRIYQTVLDAQQKAIDYILNQEKISAAEADSIARKHIISAGFPSFPHTLGHGIGLEVHEAPSLSTYSKDVLSEGMIFSIEPGIYVSKQTGVRIEDLMVIDDKGPRLLTKSPRELIIIQ